VEHVSDVDCKWWSFKRLLFLIFNRLIIIEHSSKVTKIPALLWLHFTLTP